MSDGLRSPARFSVGHRRQFTPQQRDHEVLICLCPAGTVRVLLCSPSVGEKGRQSAATGNPVRKSCADSAFAANPSTSHRYKLCRHSRGTSTSEDWPIVLLVKWEWRYVDPPFKKKKISPLTKPDAMSPGMAARLSMNFQFPSLILDHALESYQSVSCDGRVLSLIFHDQRYYNFVKAEWSQHQDIVVITSHSGCVGPPSTFRLHVCTDIAEGIIQ